MRKLKSLVLSILSLVLLVSMNSCESDSFVNTDEYVVNSVIGIEKDGNAGRRGCLEFVFPISIEFEDGTVEEVDSYEELKETIRAYKEANPDATARPQLVYPFEVITQDGEVVTIEQKSDLKPLYRDCRSNHGPWDGHGRACFRIVFPISVEFPNGEVVEVNNRRQLKQLVRAWKHNNPDSDERPMIVYPIEVELQDGTIQTVNSKEELQELKQSCRD